MEDEEKGKTRRMVRSRPMFKKVQVVYYLSRDGHLEHPHYMEVTHLANHHLRLKDVMDRLRSFRGKAMPSLYSWSCKRSYKNGYVWNDLGENDAIYPSEGAEYVLKGSHLIHHTFNDKLQSLQLGPSISHSKTGSFSFKNRAGPEETARFDDQDIQEEEEDDDDDDRAEEVEEEYEIKTNTNVSHSTCSRGVSTDEIQEFKPDNKTESSLENRSFSSPPSTTSSETIVNNSCNIVSKRFDDASPIPNEPSLSMNSMLLSLIACGGSTSFRKTVASVPKQSPARKSGCSNRAAREDMMMIGCMSENPRFGCPEEKEYFSGSIVEAIGNQTSDTHPTLKKSSSHNEERSNSIGLGEVTDEEMEKDRGVKGKCIPRKKTSSKQSKK